jgi:hypothetical protein
MIVSFSRFMARANKGVLVISPEPSRLVVGREPLGTAELPLKDDYLYFGNISQLPKPEFIGRTNLILFEDEKIAPVYLERNHLNVILTNLPDEYNRLCDDMREIFDIQMQVNNFANKLLFLVQDEAKTQKLLELGYQIFGNPLLLLDPSLFLLGSAGTESVENEPVMEHVLSKGYMPEQYLEEVMKEESDGLEEDKVLIIWEKDFLTHRLIAGRIVRGTRLIGYLKLFEYNRPITDTLDTELFKVLCQYLAISMDSIAAPHLSGPPYIEAFLLDILDQKLVDHEVISERVDLYNLELQPYKVAIIVEIEERFRKTDKLYLLKQMLQNLFRRNTIFIYGNNIAILYDRDDIDALFNISHVPNFEQLLETNHCRAAFSLPFKDLERFRAYFTQAVACLQIANRLRVTDRILSYERYKFIHMFWRFGETFDLKDLVAPSVMKLVDLDSEKDGNLAETLFAFIYHGQDITATSRAMHVHYNTLKYRISRIKELANINFDDEGTVFSIMISERVLDLLKRTESNE